MTAATLTDDEKRVLTRYGPVVICRVAGWPQAIEEQFGAPHQTASIDWPGIPQGKGPWALSRKGGIVIVRSGDHDILTGAITNPVFTLTYTRIREWVLTIPEELAEAARKASYGYADHAACAELADQLLADAPSEDVPNEELTLW